MPEDTNRRFKATAQQAEHQSVGPAKEVQEDAELDLLQILGVLWLGKWLIFLTSFVALLLGGYYAFEVAVPKYAARTSLVIEAQDQTVVNVESVISGVSTEEAAINTELEVIRSRGLLEQLVAEMDLISDPEFNERLQEPSVFSVSAIQTFLATYLPISPPAPEPEPTAEEIKNDVIETVRAAIAANSKRNTYLINITVTTTSDRKSADIANKLAELYFNDQIAIKFEATEFAVNWLSGRVTELEFELKEKEDSIKDLRAETQLISVEALEALNIRSKDLRERLLDAQVAALAANERLENYTKMAAEEDIGAIMAEVIDSRLNAQAEAARAGDTAAIRSFFDRFDQLIERARLDADRLERQRASLQAAYDNLLLEIDEQNADLVRLNQLVREADATRILYETFLTRLKEISVQIGLQQADIRVLSQATPGELVAPRKSIILALSLILGAMIGIGIALLRHLMHDQVRTAEQLEQLTGQVVWGQIPKMPIKRRKGLTNYLHSSPTSAAAEAVRNLRTSILMSNLDDPPKVIMSTSSLPGDGKTTNAIALALNFAGMGKKVLLIEGDIRRRTLGQYFPQTPPGSLIKVVLGDQSLPEAVIQDDKLKIDVLMGEKYSINAADFFSSEKFKQFIEDTRLAYDVVIIDTPPVLVVPDARVVGHIADVILFSVCWDRTGKQQVVDGLRELSTVGLRVSGLVLGRIDIKRMSKFGYSGKYASYGSYGKGYYDI